MRNKKWKVFIAMSLISLSSCSQKQEEPKADQKEITEKEVECKKTEPHPYGGWYCPDNLNGFPAVDIANWETVPVINGRMATQEETQTEASLIYVDPVKYPNAKVLDMTMPRLASIYNYSTNREDIIILIQALNIDNDSIVGYRFLNGGNGSARLSEVKLLSDQEISKIQEGKFISISINIAATQEDIWEVISKSENVKSLQPIFDKENKLKSEWRKSANINYHYAIPGILTASFAGNLYGCYYVQNDYDTYNYTEKFLLIENEDTKHTDLKITCGPFGADYDTQKIILHDWAKKVKELSEEKLQHYTIPK